MNLSTTCKGVDNVHAKAGSAGYELSTINNLIDLSYIISQTSHMMGWLIL